MRADTSADLGQGAVLMIKICGVREAPLFDQPHAGGDIVVCWACHHAGSGIRTMDATRSLDHGALRTEINDHITKIARSFLGISQVQVVEWHIGAGLAVDCQILAGYKLHAFLQLAN